MVKHLVDTRGFISGKRMGSMFKGLSTSNEGDSMTAYLATFKGSKIAGDSTVLWPWKACKGGEGERNMAGIETPKQGGVCEQSCNQCLAARVVDG